MKMKSLILIFLFVLCLKVVPGEANPFDSMLSSFQSFWEQVKSIFVKTEKNIQASGEQLVKKGNQAIKEMMYELNKISKTYLQATSSISFDKCQCRNQLCDCCFYLKVQQIALNHKGCLTQTYLPNDYGFQFTFKLNDKLVMDKSISVKNPPPICATVPYLQDLASLCLRFYSKDNQIFPGCTALEAKLGGIIVESFELGCVKPRA